MDLENLMPETVARLKDPGLLPARRKNNGSENNDYRLGICGDSSGNANVHYSGEALEIHS